MSELKASDVRHIEISRTVGDLSQIEQFIEGYKNEDAWRMKLTQAQDVREWVIDPESIDPAIKPNLDRFGAMIRKRAGRTTVLDMGCYAGYVYDYLRVGCKILNGQLTYMGVDIRPEAIEGAKELHKNHPETSFKVGSVFDIGEPDSHDIVFSARVLIHLPNFRQAVENMINMAREYAFLAIKVEERGSCRRMRKHDKTRDEIMDYFYRTVSFDDLKEIARDFKVKVKVEERGKAYQSVILRK